MLVLSRKIGERIVIAGNVEITVSQIHKGRVRLAVNAPRQVSITRYEMRTAEGRSGDVTRGCTALPSADLDAPVLPR